LFWPADNYTKGDLIDYYRSVARWILPYLRDRPVVMTRFPDGIDGKSFFQKDAPGFAPEWIRREAMWSEDTERDINYFVADTEESLLYIVNLASIPLHIWASRVATLEQPDWCVIDLDPGEAPFGHVVEIAQALHRVCDEIELPNFVKTTGKTGLHILVPLGRKLTFDQTKAMGELLARVVMAELPEIATIARLPAHREGKVYVDYLQNGRGKLIVSPFCVRPLEGAPLSMPLARDEVNDTLNVRDHTIKNAPQRLATLGEDLMRPVIELKPDLHAILERLGRMME
jgi:bifunctional non-homologous end joining protein LigD